MLTEEEEEEEEEEETRSVNQIMDKLQHFYWKRPFDPVTPNDPTLTFDPIT